MLNQLALFYVKSMSELKPYNLQSISIKNFFKKIDQKEFLKDMNLEPNQFLMKFTPMITRDLYFKNHTFETRNMKLISPEQYIYFTKLVFQLVLSTLKKTKLKTYNSDHIETYYSGFLYNDINLNIEKNKTVYNGSYGKFLESLANYEGHEVLTVDLSNFFDSIKFKNLFDQLRMNYSDKEVDPLKIFTKKVNIKTLPQFHFSIASSILSQEYLSSFDLEIESLLKKNNLKLIRYVDDMYFINRNKNKPMGDKFYFKLLDHISYIAWKYNLNINANKTKIYSGHKPFSIKLMDNSYGSNFLSEVRIENKADSITSSDFIQFVKQVDTLYLQQGFNMREFKKYFDNTFAIDGEDGQKVLNTFVFKLKWRKFDSDILKETLKYYRFVFYLPNPLLVLYLKIYDYIENQYGRNYKYISKLVRDLDKSINYSIRNLNTTVNYLIQRGFKRKSMLEGIGNYDSNMKKFIDDYIIS